MTKREHINIYQFQIKSSLLVLKKKKKKSVEGRQEDESEPLCCYYLVELFLPEQFNEEL